MKYDPFAELKQKTAAAYNAGSAAPTDPVPEYRILFVLFRSVTVGGKTYIVGKGGLAERIFYEAVENFKYAVENLARGCVRIVPTVREVEENTVSTVTTYLQHSDIALTVAALAPAGMYDAVISASGGKWEYGGAACPPMLTRCAENNWRMYGYAGCSIAVDFDRNSVGRRYDKRTPYLLTTNYFIHEWLHLLEGYREFMKTPAAGIIYPYTHLYYEDYRKPPTEPWMRMQSYRWDQKYYASRLRYPHTVEPEFTAFYRAVLAGEVTYLPTGQRVGMHPALWRITPHRLFRQPPATCRMIPDGRYRIMEAAAGTYLAGSGSDIRQAAQGTVWTFIHTGEGYYAIFTESGGQKLLFDVLCACDREGIKVQLYPQTGYPEAQSWQILSAQGGGLLLRPMLSQSRLLRITADGAVLSGSGTRFALKKMG